MKLRTRVFTQLAAVLLVLGASAFAANDGYLYIVHGIPGPDIADNLNPGLPVDILIDGTCPQRGLTFGNTAGPLTLPAGTYDVHISMANTLAPCTNPPIIDSQVTLKAAASVSVVAAISGTQPALLQFADNLTPVAPGKSRFVFANSADAPALQATLTQLFVKNPKTFTVTANPGARRMRSRTGRHLSGAGGWRPAARPCWHRNRYFWPTSPPTSRTRRARQSITRWA